MPGQRGLVSKMFDAALLQEEPESRPVGVPVDHAPIGAGLADLGGRALDGLLPGSLHLVFPPDDPGRREPSAQLGQDLGRRTQRQADLPRPAAQLGRSRGSLNARDYKIAEGCRVQDDVRRARERAQPTGERLVRREIPHLAPGGSRSG